MAFSASSVSGSLSPFVACPSQVCLGCVPGIVEDDAVDLGLVLGLVLEVEEEEEERGLALFCEVVLMSCGFVLWSNRLCSRVSDFGAALARVLGGCMPGIVEDDAVDLGLVLGLVLEVEEEGEERGLVILPEVVLIIRGFVPRSDRLCSRVSDFGVALVGVLVEVRVRLVVVEESPAVGRVDFVCLLAFVALEGVPVVVRVRLVVVGASLVVGRAVLCLFWLCASFGFLSLLCRVCPTRMPT